MACSIVNFTLSVPLKLLLQCRLSLLLLLYTLNYKISALRSFTLALSDYFVLLKCKLTKRTQFVIIKVITLYLCYCNYNVWAR